MRCIPKPFYEPSDYDNYPENRKKQMILNTIMLCLVFAVLWLLPTDDSKPSVEVIIVVVAVWFAFIWIVGLSLTYTESHRKLCMAVAYLQLASMGEPNGIEVRTAHDLVLVIPGMTYEVAERVVHGDYDNLLSHQCTCRFIH